MNARVECRSGFTYAQRPVALIWQGQRHTIEQIIKEWRTPETKCFRVRTQDGQNFELCYYEARDEWEIREN